MSDYDDRPSRENMMQRRLRKARGEEVSDEVELYEPYDEEEEERPRSFGGGYQRYSRQPPAYAGGGGCTQPFLFGALALIGAVLVGVLLFNQAMGQLGERLPSLPDVREIIITPTPQIITGAAVVQRVQQLSRLETASYTIQTVIDVSQGSSLPVLGDYLPGDELLLIAQAKVVAGVDLSKLSQDSVTVAPDGRAITLRLPPAEIFEVVPNNAGTRVYSTRQGWFTPNSQNLETLARQQADQQILAAACEDNILVEATEQAETALRQFLGLLDNVQVTVVPASPALCSPPATPTSTAP